MKKRIQKGLTLIELVIAMALSTIVIGGAVIVFLSLDRLSKAETKSFSELSDARGLVTAIDQILSDSAGNNSAEVEDVVVSEGYYLFTVTTHDNDNEIDIQYYYYFSGTTLRAKNKTTSEIQDVYSIDHSITVSRDYLSDLQLYRFTFQYGKDNSIYLIKKIG